MAEIRMPKMGDGMTEGTVLKWLKKEGDRIELNESIAEIETDKANVEMPADEAGTLTKILVKEGETVAVGTPIAQIGDGVAAAAPTAPPLSTNGASAEARDDAVVSDRAEPASSKEQAAPSAEPSKAQPPATGPAAERVKATPLARKTARDLGIDMALVPGTGPGGQIRQRDVLAFQDRGGKSPALPAAPERTRTPAPATATAAPTLAGKDEDVSKMRKAIARRTVLSKQTIPHFYVTMAIDMDRAMDLLADINAEAGEDGDKVTVNDLIVKACALALAKFPDVNVSWTPEDKVRRYDAFNIGVAVGTNEGLTVPVIQDCGSKSLRQISMEARDLINRARGGQLTPQEMSGGTFSVSNLGMFGVEEFAAIINPPESAILAVGGVAPEVTVADDGSFEARRRMRVTLSCDHRTVDGLLGARFLQEVKRLLEHPLLILV